MLDPLITRYTPCLPDKEIFLPDFIRRLFHKPVRRPETANAAPLDEKPFEITVSDSGEQMEMQQLISACGQSIGKQRNLNEDSLLAVTYTLSGNGGNTPFGLYIVADGMGGHQYGEIASNAAIRVVAGVILRKFQNSIFNLKPEVPDESLQEIMQNAVNEAQKMIQRVAPGGGTTLTATLILGQQMTIAHVGDSRAYMVQPDGQIEVVTHDHSLVKRLEEMGHILPEDAEHSPQRNVLYRALGQGDHLEADIFTIPFPTGRLLILCSDGLWGVLSGQELLRLVREAPSLERACRNLVAAANAAGGPDNISVVLVQSIG